MRLFVAVEIPLDRRIATRDAVEPLRTALPRARWVPLENWHVTVKFLGETTDEIAGRTADRLEEVSANVVAFTTNLTGLGAFPSPKAARVVWAGLDDRSGRMAVLALAVDAVLADAFAPSTRPFTPHLTLARADPPARLPASFADVPVPGEPFSIGELVLFRSHPGPPAPRYEALARAAFRG